MTKVSLSVSMVVEVRVVVVRVVVMWVLPKTTRPNKVDGDGSI